MPGDGMVLKEKVFEIATARNALSASPTIALDLVRDLPDVPVLSETLLLMELKVRERAVDLNEISQLVLSDLGACLQIMRLAGREDSPSGDHLKRIEDCISGLGLQACIEAMSRRTIMRSRRQPAVLETWLHARIIAENCRFLAEEASWPVSPDEAYVVGLFHPIGTLPDVFDWDCSAFLSNDPSLAALRMAEAWSLPPCVVEYFSELRPFSNSHRWTQIVEQAHQQASLPLVECNSGNQFPISIHSDRSMQLV
jgi:hypothetical protein